MNFPSTLQGYKFFNFWEWTASRDSPYWEHKFVGLKALMFPAKKQIGIYLIFMSSMTETMSIKVSTFFLKGAFFIKVRTISKYHIYGSEFQSIHMMWCFQNATSETACSTKLPKLFWKHQQSNPQLGSQRAKKENCLWEFNSSVNWQNMNQHETFSVNLLLK